MASVALTKAVAKYIEVLQTPPNAWGVHGFLNHHNQFITTDDMMHFMFNVFGDDVTSAEIDRQLGANNEQS